MNFAQQIYRRLAQAFPHEFNVAYGDSMRQAGEDAWQDVSRRHGAAGLTRLIADTAVHLPVEYLSEMRRDMRQAVRSLVQSPSFALVGIVSMGLGIGLTTEIYTSKWEMLARQLPVANAARLVIADKPVSYYSIEQYRNEKDLFAGAAAVQTGVPFSISLHGQREKPERVSGQLVSPDYFAVLGVRAQRGRVFSPSVDNSGEAPVVVISDRFWRNRLQSSPDAVGQTLRVNGQTATIVGITPEHFEGALFVKSEVFVPITAPAIAPELANGVLEQHTAREFLALMCLAPGVSITSAEAAINTVTRRIDAQDSSSLARLDKARSLTLIPAGTLVPVPRNLRPIVAGFFILLMALIMTIACMNLGNMLLARGAGRRKELALRVGLGASRFRIIRQMISEGMVLSLAGGVAGLALAYGMSVLDSQLPQVVGTQVPQMPSMDWHAAVFAFAVAVLCGVAFSVAPALHATRTDIAVALKEGSALQLSGFRRFGLRNLAVAGQITGSLTLLLITGFLVLGITEGARVQTNFDPRAMYLMSIDPVRDGYTPAQTEALCKTITARLESDPRVRSVAFAAQQPYAIQDEDTKAPMVAEDSAAGSKLEQPVIREAVGAGYFSALGEPVLGGREFEIRDERTNPDASSALGLPVVLNQDAAHAFFGNGNAIGRHLRDDAHSYQVVGVSPDLKDGSGITQPILYEPLTRREFMHPPAGGLVIIVRANATAASLSDIASVVTSVDPKLNLFDVQTLAQYLERSRSIMWSAVRTYGGIGFFGLVLSAIGLAGITAYTVAQRGREIGIRMALGARKAQVLSLVLREGASLIAAGTILGLAAAFAIAKALSALTKDFADSFKIGTNDPRLLFGAPLLLAAIALFACYVPARRAAKIDPLNALRQP